MQKQVKAVAEMLRERIAAASSDEALSKIRKVWTGDPILVAKADLPCLVVRSPNAQIASRGTIHDNRTYSMQIRFVFDIRDTMGSTNEGNIDFETIANDIFLLENPDGTLSSNCICQILREDQTTGGVGKINTDFSII